MIKMPPKSSMIANAVKKTFNDNGTRLPSKDKTPSENAMSVAVGIAQPCVFSEPALNAKNINAGNNIPPNAANNGNNTFFGDDNSPVISSRFISKPTKKKKIAISKSFTQCSMCIEIKLFPIS